MSGAALNNGANFFHIMFSVIMRSLPRAGRTFVTIRARGISDVSVGKEEPSCQRLAIVGSGIMAEAIVSGMLESGFLPASKVVAFDVNPKRTQHFVDEFGTEAAATIEECVQDADMILLAVKPQNMITVCEKLRPVVSESATLITMAAGVPMEALVRSVPQAKRPNPRPAPST